MTGWNMNGDEPYQRQYQCHNPKCSRRICIYAKGNNQGTPGLKASGHAPKQAPKYRGWL
jgi:hypothetical protein